MTPAQIQLLVLRGLMSQMPPEHQRKAEDCRVKLQQLLTEHGDYGKLTFAMMALEMAVEEGE